MQKQEFEKRTPFLDKTDHENYADWFEPAYMGAKNIDKDDFCAMLKDKTVRKFDRRMVHVVGRRAWRFARNQGRGAETWRGDFVPCLMRGACTDGRVYLGNAANVGRPEEVVRFLSDEDMRRMRRGYMAVRTDFRKRLNAYWKRFGASKIHTWTYWTEA